MLLFSSPLTNMCELLLYSSVYVLCIPVIVLLPSFSIFTESVVKYVTSFTFRKYFKIHVNYSGQLLRTKNVYINQNYDTITIFLVTSVDYLMLQSIHVELCILCHTTRTCAYMGHWAFYDTRALVGRSGQLVMYCHHRCCGSCFQHSARMLCWSNMQKHVSSTSQRIYWSKQISWEFSVQSTVSGYDQIWNVALLLLQARCRMYDVYIYVIYLSFIEVCTYTWRLIIFFNWTFH